MLTLGRHNKYRLVPMKEGDPITANCYRVEYPPHVWTPILAGEEEAEEEEEDEEIMEEEVTASEEPEEEQEPVDTDEQEDLPFYEGEALRDKKEPLKLFKKPSIKISAWIKSRMFDVLFIAGLWFVTLWIASYLTSVTVFQLISNSTLAVIVFFIILLSVYLFCFLFFLGETIGDYVFPKNDS